MIWMRLEGRRGLPPRSIGLTGTATQTMLAAHFNVVETYVLPAAVCRRVVAGAKLLVEARQAAQRYEFATEAPSFARLVDAVGPDVLVRCSPVVPRSWTWFPLEPFDDAIVIGDADQLRETIRQSWLTLFDDAVIQNAREAGVSEAMYLATASAAILAQPADLHPGLSGRAWSPNGELGQPHAVVQCALQTTEADGSVWEWTVSTAQKVVTRPTPTPTDERPVLEAASLVTQLGSMLSTPCVLDWTWDGQALAFLAARPVFVHPATRVFSRQALARLSPRRLSPMAAAILVELLTDLARDADTMLLGTHAPTVPQDAARSFDGYVYLDASFARSMMDRAGLPHDLLESLLLQRQHERGRFTLRQLLRSRHAVRAATAVRLAVPRFEKWISDNAERLAELDGMPPAIASAQEGLMQLQQLLSFLRPLFLNLILLLASSSLRGHDLERALARRGMEERLPAALKAATDTAGLDPWTHLDRIAARIDDASAARAAEALAAGDPDRAVTLLCADTTVGRDVDAFLQAFSFFRTAIIDVSSPTLQERRDLLPAALLRARETGAAARVAAAEDPNAWLEALPGGNDILLQRRYRAVMKTSAITEKAWFYIAKSLSRARLILLAVGDLLVTQGQLAARGDVFLLTPAELTGGTDLRQVVADRAPTAAGATPPPDVIVIPRDS